MEVTFHNVTIVIEAETPEAAYKQLTEALEPLIARGILEYGTDSFTTAEAPNDKRDTQELWDDSDDCCDECGNVIPDDAEGTVNEHHAESCSLHPSATKPRCTECDIIDPKNPWDHYEFCSHYRKEVNQREKGDDDGVEYADPRDEKEGR